MGIVFREVTPCLVTAFDACFNSASRYPLRDVAKACERR